MKKKIFLLPLNLKNKTKFLLSQIDKLNLANNFIYITSNFCKVQDFKLNFYNYFKNSALPFSFTLKSFASKIISEKSSKKIISDVERFLIIIDIIKKEKKEKFYGYTDEGFAKIVLNFIKELKISSIQKVKLSEVKNIISGFPFKFENHKKNIELALNLFEEYENYLYKRNLIDIEDIYDEATNHLTENYESIIFENIVEIPNYQRNFIAKLVKSTESVIFSYYQPDCFSIDTQKLIINDTFNFLKKIINWEIEKIDGEKYEPEIECFNYPTKEEEIKGIINLIEREFKNNKEIGLDDFLITCPDMLNYRNYIKRIFSRFNLPVELIPGYSFIIEPSISPLLEFFTLAETYEWNTLMNILTSPYFSKINQNEVENFSEKIREEYENIGFYKENFDFEKINYKSIEILKECTNLIKKEMTISEWKDTLEKIIEMTGWHTSEPEIKIEFEKLIDKMNGSYLLKKEEFINLLKKLLEMIEIEEGKGMGIRVSGIMESLGIEKKICFFCGATEENFPNAPKIEEFLLPDKVKKELGLEYFEKRIARDRCDFYRIRNEHEKVIFTFPSRVENQLQMKSIFIFDISPKEEITKEFSIDSKKIFDIKIDISKFKKKYIQNGKLNIGVSDLELLLKCPYKFYLQKVEEIKPYRIPEIREIPDMWGKIIHESIKETFEKEKYINVEKIKEYKDIFETLLNKKADEYLKKNKISSIYRNIVKLRQIEVLKKFEKIIKNFSGMVLLDFEKDIKFENEKLIKDLIIKGRIDILAKMDDKLTIIDIKTGTSWNCSYTENDFFKQCNIQIPLYAWIYSTTNNISYKNIKGMVCNFSFIENEKESEIITIYDFSTKKFNYIEKISEFLNDIKEEILQDKFSFLKVNNESECFICNYKELCIYEK
ncbi:MAG TPA: PD-(D/E)XK nuclease family protein [bacterium]|nr:PD-(D/E)XK nuclease family protein [bacterium]